jgi:hypothetical protein
MQTLEDSLVVLRKFSTWSSNHAHWHWWKGLVNLCLHKNLYMDVYSSFICNFQNLEATRMAFSGWMDKLMYTDWEYYSVLKWNELSSHEKTGRNFECILLSKRKQSEKSTHRFIPCDILGKDKTLEKAEISSGCPGIGVRKIKGRA